MAPEFGKSIYQLPLIPADGIKKLRVRELLERGSPFGLKQGGQIAGHAGSGTSASPA